MTKEVTDREVKVTLVKALNLIDDPDKWIVGAECQVVGKYANHKPKFAYCSVGAINAVTSGYRLPTSGIPEWVDQDDPVECVPNVQPASERAKADAALVALGEALEELDYREVWTDDGWDEEQEHDADTARAQVIEFNDDDEHARVIEVFKKAIERVAQRMGRRT